jgi:hypothetical protein
MLQRSPPRRCRSTEPYQNTGRFTINVSHEGNLGIFLLNRALVDADGVDPNHAISSTPIQVPKSGLTISRDEKLTAIADDRTIRSLVIPGVRKRVEYGIVVQAYRPKGDVELVALMAGGICQLNDSDIARTER